MQAFEAMWQAAARFAEAGRLPERSIGPICEAAFGLRVKRATYVANVEVTYGETIPDLTASRDLRALVSAELFVPIGDTRGRYYVASERLVAAWEEVRSARPPKDEDDPFVLVANSNQTRLDFAATEAT